MLYIILGLLILAGLLTINLSILDAILKELKLMNINIGITSIQVTESNNLLKNIHNHIKHEITKTLNVNLREN